MAADGPPDPSKSTADEIKQTLTERTGVESGLSFGEEPPSSKSAAIEAASALVNALEIESAKSAKSAEAIGEVAVHEVRDALDRGLDPAAVLGAGLASHAISAEDADALSWQLARQDAGYESDDELYKLGDDAELEQVDSTQEQLLGAATALAQMQSAQRQAERASEAAFAAQVAEHEKSVVAMKALQHELQLPASAFEDHLREIDAAAESGLLGTAVDLDRLAANDSALFAAALKSISATLRESEAEQEAQAIKHNVFASQPEFASGWSFDGQPAGPEPYVPTFDEEKFSDRVVQRSLGGGRFDQPVALPRERSIKDGWTSDGRPVHPDDLPLEGGGTAKSRLADELRKGRERS